jgi:hypothetical protein
VNRAQAIRWAGYAIAAACAALHFATTEARPPVSRLPLPGSYVELPELWPGGPGCHEPSTIVRLPGRS